MATLLRSLLVLTLLVSSCTETTYVYVCQVTNGADTTYVPYDPDICGPPDTTTAAP